MNLDRAAIVLRERTILDGLDLAIRFVFTLNRKLYAQVSVLVLLPCLALCAAAKIWGQWSWLWVWLLAWSLATVSQGAFTVVAGRLMFSEDVTLRIVLRELSRRLSSYVGGLILTRLVIALGSLLLVVAPYAWARGAYVYEAILLEGASAQEGTRRAGNFVKYHLAHTVGVLMGLTTMQLGATIVAEYLGHGLVRFVLQLGEPVGDLFHDGGSGYALIGFFASVPFTATARFLSYIDARTRRDGWDIQVRFAAVEANADSSVR